MDNMDVLRNFNNVKIYSMVGLITFISINPAISLLVGEISVPYGGFEINKTSSVASYTNFKGLGILGCVKKCLVRGDCLSLTYSSVTLTCHLFDRSLLQSELRYEPNAMYTGRHIWDQESLNGCGSLQCANGSACLSSRDGSVNCVATECGSTPKVANGVATTVGQWKGFLAYYQCDVGTYVEGETNRLCLPTGQWQPDHFTCHLQCPPAPVISDATLDSPLRIVGRYTNYTCVNDTSLFGEASLLCQENQTWSSIDFECRRHCPIPPTVVDASTNTSVRFVGTVLNYTCHPRADLFGTPIIVCQRNQTWSDITFECIRQCPVAPQVEFAAPTTEVRVVGTTIHYVCGNDTYLDGNSALLCQTDQTWAPIKFTCREQCTDPPPSVPFSTFSSGTRIIGDVETYTCNDTYDMVGTPNIECYSNKTWSDISFECKEACPTPPAVPFASPVPGPKLVNDVVTYNCQSTYDAIGIPTISCQSNQTWTNIDFECRAACPVPPSVVNAAPDFTHKTVGERINYTCAVGHDPVGTPQILCQDNQVWTTVNFQCKAACPPPPHITNSAAVAGPKTVGSRVSYECDDGYDPVGAPNLLCQPNQLWAEIGFNCSEACYDPPTVENATLVPGRKLIGDTVSYSCKTGYDPTGPLQISCQTERIWSPVKFQCLKACAPPPQITLGSVVYQDKFIGSNATYSCSPRTIDNGSPNTIVCKPNQQWTTTNFHCTKVCDAPPTVANSTKVPGPITVGSTQHYECDDGFDPVGTPNIKCQNNQLWTNVNFYCKLACQPPPTISNGAPRNGPKTVGEVITYDCNTNYDPLGQRSITCQNNQTWTAVQVECKAACPPPPQIADGSISHENKFVGTNATYTCLPRTIDNGLLDTIICQQNHEWTTTNFNCTKVCDAPPTVANSTKVPGPITVGSTQHYECDDGFDPVGTPNIKCQNNQLWTNVNFYCKLACQPPPTISNGAPRNGPKTVGEVITYDCNTNYDPLGQRSITCQNNQTWTAVQVECKAACPPPPQIADGSISHENKFVGTNATYTCLPRTIDNGLLDTIICQQNHEWTTTNFNCTKVCDAPPTVANSTKVPGPITVGSTQHYECDDGFDPVGTPNIKCQNNQLWTNMEFYCKLACEDPPTLLNGGARPGSKTIGDIKSYACDTGFDPFGNPNITCLSNQTWTPVEVECKLACPPPPPITLASVYHEDKFIGSNATYNCSSGTIDNGSPSTIVCESNQKWTTTEYNCTKVCGDPPQITNSTMTSEAKTVGSVISYTCDVGFDVVGSTMEITCQPNQLWTEIGFYCKLACQEPPSIMNAVASSGPKTIGDVISYTCETSYELLGNPNITCQANQTWSTMEMECKPACPPPPDIVDGTVHYEDKFIGSNATYNCSSGTIDNGSPSTIVCESNQKWTTTEYNCTKACEDPPTLLNGGARPGSKTIGDIKSYACDTGFDPFGNPNITCLSNQTWTPVEVECKPACPPPPPITLASVYHEDKFIGSNATYNCSSGTIDNGSPSTIVCESNQKWTTTEYNCTKVCGDPPQITNSTMTSEAKTVGSVISYTCDVGFDVVGSTMEITCQPNQLWTEIGFYCKLACQEPPSIMNAVASSGPKTIGDVISYTCETSYELLGNPNITCQANQTWSTMEMECKPVCPEPPELAYATVEFEDVFVGSNATYACKNRLPTKGNPVITCHSNQLWTEPSFTC